MRPLLPLFLWFGACRCGEAPISTPLHVQGFDGFVDAARRGDRDDAVEFGRQLAVSPPDATWEDRAGAAVGMASLAEDPGELAAAAARVASACGACHRDRGVPAPASPHAAHRRAADWIVRPVLFDLSDPPPAGVLPPEVDAATAGGGSPEERLAAALVACASCHLASDAGRGPG